MHAPPQCASHRPGDVERQCLRTAPALVRCRAAAGGGWQARDVVSGVVAGAGVGVDASSVHCPVWNGLCIEHCGIRGTCSDVDGSLSTVVRWVQDGCLSDFLA